MSKTINDIDDLKIRFRHDAEATIKSVYDEYKLNFISYALSMTKDKHLIIDVYQEAVIGLYQNLLNEKITNNKASVKTYLFEIGKRQLYTALNKGSKEIYHENPMILSSKAKYYEPTTDQNDTIKKSIRMLGLTCQKLLTLFYYRNYSIDAIVHELNMKNENSVKANKSRCLKNLQQIIKSNTYVN